jgi:hypothetical protein
MKWEVLSVDELRKMRRYALEIMAEINQELERRTPPDA